MKVHYIVRRSEPLWPRIMRRLPERGRRSVGAGLRRRGIELRNQTSGVSTLCNYGEDNTVRSDMRGAYRPTESETLTACVEVPCAGAGRAWKRLGDVLHRDRLGKVYDRNPDVYATRQSDRPIVPGKPSNKGPQPGRPAKDRRRRWRKGGLAKGNSLKFYMYRTQERRERYGKL